MLKMCSKEMDYFGDTIRQEEQRNQVAKKHPDHLQLKSIKDDLLNSSKLREICNDHETNLFEAETNIYFNRQMNSIMHFKSQPHSRNSNNNKYKSINGIWISLIEI